MLKLIFESKEQVIENHDVKILFDSELFHAIHKFIGCVLFKMKLHVMLMIKMMMHVILYHKK